MFDAKFQDNEEDNESPVLSMMKKKNRLSPAAMSAK